MNLACVPCSIGVYKYLFYITLYLLRLGTCLFISCKCLIKAMHIV